MIYHYLGYFKLILRYAQDDSFVQDDSIAQNDSFIEWSTSPPIGSE
jgi:hypothetical protein